MGNSLKRDPALLFAQARQEVEDLIGEMGSGKSNDEHFERILTLGFVTTIAELPQFSDLTTGRPDSWNPQRLWFVARVYWETQRWTQFKSLVQSAPEMGTNSSPLVARVYLRDAWRRLLAENSPSSALSVIESVEASPCGDSALILADLAHLRGYIEQHVRGNVTSALRQTDLAVALYEHLGEHELLCKNLIQQSFQRLQSAQLAGALLSSSRAVDVATAIPNVRLLTRAWMQHGICLYRKGATHEALTCFDVATNASTAVGETRWELRLRLAKARALLLAGATAEARHLLEEDGPDREVQDTLRIQAIHEEYLGIADLAEFKPADALLRFDRSEQLLIEAHVHSYERAEINLRKAEAYNALGRYQDSMEQCIEGLTKLDKVGEGLERGHLLRVKGLALHGLGRPHEASEAFQASERELRHVGDILELAKLLLDKAELSKGDAESRVADAAEAMNLLQRVGIESETQRARDILEMTQSVLRMQHRQDIDSTVDFDTKFIAESAALKSLLAESKKCARSDAPAVVLGETGVGKELFARFLHDNSSRSAKPFVAVNCAAIPASLFEREFFGHVKGAYTGADRDREGLLESAHGGTLFLDEVGELPLEMQSKLLRVLQDGTFRRVGETRERTADLRVIAATNRGLVDQIRKGGFREDLYYRLAWFEFSIPPLREREEDIDALIKFFLLRESARMGVTFWIDKFAWTTLRRYVWPGNVRELEATIGSACARAGSDGSIGVEHLPSRVAKDEPIREHPDSELNLPEAIERRERELIMEALRRSDQRKAEAAKLLCIGRNTLYDKLKKHSIDPEPTFGKKARG